MSNAETKKTLVMKLAEVMAAVERIAKTGYNEFHKYEYARESDIVDAIRGELASRHIIIFPSIVDLKRTPHDIETVKWINGAPTPQIRKTQLTEIVVRWKFVDGESGEVFEIDIPGVGEDNVDKGFYKAFTGSEKYMLMKTFLIPTGDDPERETKDESGAIREEKKSKAQQVAKDKIKASESQETPSLWYIWHEESQTATIDGPDSLKTALKPVLKPLWDGNTRTISANADQLNALQYELEQRKIGLNKKRT